MLVEQDFQTFITFMDYLKYMSNETIRANCPNLEIHDFDLIVLKTPFVEELKKSAQFWKEKLEQHQYGSEIHRKMQETELRIVEGILNQIEIYGKGSIAPIDWYTKKVVGYFCRTCNKEYEGHLKSIYDCSSDDIIYICEAGHEIGREIGGNWTVY